MTETVPIGHMRLYSHMRPGMLAGTYQIDLDQDFGSTTRPVDRVTKFIEVTGPRFGLPGTEIHGVFPPHNSVGPFHNQLPHIALKRRTLPWERPGDPDSEERGERLPWLALVILSDGEANFVRNMAVKDVIPGRLQDGIADDAVCDAIEVTTTTVEKVFPGEAEFPYLLHVRQVNVNDTENAGNDEDGYMAVVMANRLPRRGQNYGAYLISVEGRYEDLPDAGTPTDNVGDASVYTLSAEQLVAASYSGGSGASRMALAATEQPKHKATPGAGFAASGAVGASTGTGVVSTESRANVWHAAAPEADVATPSDDQSAGVAAHSTMTVINDMDLRAVEPEATLVRFPVLAHWQFACTDGFDFRELMINLDVAMLGNPPAAGPGVNPPQVTDSGHVLIDNLIRGGERVSAWYRGPFTPRQVRRRLRDVPFHGADQARTIGGDFTESLGEAAAFEIGRMLALADPSFLQELLRWRRDGFRRLKTASLLDGSGLGDLLVDGVAVAGLGRLLARDLYVGIGAGGLGPQIDPVGGLRLGDEDAALIAGGLGTPIARVRSALGIGAELTVPGAPVGSAPRLEITAFDDLVAAGDVELAHLRTELDHTVDGIAADAQPNDLRRGDG